MPDTPHIPGPPSFSQIRSRGHRPLMSGRPRLQFSCTIDERTLTQLMQWRDRGDGWRPLSGGMLLDQMTDFCNANKFAPKK